MILPWVLILSYLTTDGVVVTSIPGFGSQTMCQGAASQWMAEMVRLRNVEKWGRRMGGPSAICVRAR